MQRQIDLVYEELRVVSLMEDLLSNWPAALSSYGSEYLQQEEKNIRKRISFLESLREKVSSLQAEVGNDMDEVLRLMSSTGKYNENTRDRRVYLPQVGTTK